MANNNLFEVTEIELEDEMKEIDDSLTSNLQEIYKEHNCVYPLATGVMQLNELYHGDKRDVDHLWYLTWLMNGLNCRRFNMSTRCQVGLLPYITREIEDCKLFLYKHHDGYPEYMLPLLKRHVEEYLKRNDYVYDTQDMSAWVFFELMTDYLELGKKMRAEATQGCKICNPEHGRYYGEFSFDYDLIEYTDYVYIIYPDRIEAWEGGGWGHGKSEHKVIETVAITLGPSNAEPEVEVMTNEIPDMFVTN